MKHLLQCLTHNRCGVGAWWDDNIAFGYNVSFDKHVLDINSLSDSRSIGEKTMYPLPGLNFHNTQSNQPKMSRYILSPLLCLFPHGVRMVVDVIIKC